MGLYIYIYFCVCRDWTLVDNGLPLVLFDKRGISCRGPHQNSPRKGAKSFPLPLKKMLQRFISIPRRTHNKSLFAGGPGIISVLVSATRKNFLLFFPMSEKRRPSSSMLMSVVLFPLLVPVFSVPHVKELRHAVIWPNMNFSCKYRYLLEGFQ